MQCGQGKPFTVTSTNSKMGSAAVRSYEEGGEVTKPKMQTMPNRNPQGDKPKMETMPNNSSQSKFEMQTMPNRNPGSIRNLGIYTAEMGEPPQDTDMMTSLTPAQRKAAEARIKQSKKK
jgi:hypothetical protein